MNQPQVSVVMGVFNNHSSLATTIESVLTQQGVSFEFIIVNDGSTDDSEQIIQHFAADDKRIKLINQSNQGLTRALINGCAQAQASYIARQDAGDVSLANRLVKQFNTLQTETDIVMLSAGTRFKSQQGHVLYDIIQPSDEADLSLRQSQPELIKGPPHHGSVMFRRAIYQQVGGYRPEFYVAQDIDLWTRLVEHGKHDSLSEVLYQATVERNSISMLRREQQLQALITIGACVEARALNGNDHNILDSIKKPDLGNNTPDRNTDADYYYFVGSNLLRKAPRSSRHFFIQALKHRPLAWKAASKLVYSYWLTALQGLARL